MVGFFQWEWDDPGDCPICGAPHTTCTAPTPIVSPIASAATGVTLPAGTAPPSDEFTTATYSRKRNKPRTT